MVDVGVADLQCPCKVYHKITKIDQNQGWTLALKTYCVLELCLVYHTKIHNSRVDVGVANLQKFPKSTLTKSKHSRVGGRWRCKLTMSQQIAKSTIQQYQNLRVDVGLTNLQCP